MCRGEVLEKVLASEKLSSAAREVKAQRGDVKHSSATKIKESKMQTKHRLRTI
jgi:hypothetical protein